MITPNRYHLWAALECHAFSKAEAVLRFSAEEDGMWVQWQDYARLKADAQVILKHLDEASADCASLKAEVERLRASSFVTAVPVEEYEKLKAEVERLRKAGDACADAAYAHCMCQDCEELRDQWRDAKRGNQP